MPCSAAKIEANRRNAQHSTGPRSAAGKARMRQNARRHGLAAQDMRLSNAEKCRRWRMVQKWIEFQPPHDDIERALIEQIATARIVLQRICDHAEAASAEVERTAPERFERDLAARVQSDIAELETKPWLAARRLAQTVAGCDWLLERWDELRQAFENGGWSLEQTHRALRFWGRDPADWHVDTLLGTLSEPDWPRTHGVWVRAADGRRDCAAGRGSGGCADRRGRGARRRGRFERSDARDHGFPAPLRAALDARAVSEPGCPESPAHRP